MLQHLRTKTALYPRSIYFLAIAILSVSVDKFFLEDLLES